VVLDGVLTDTEFGCNVLVAEAITLAVGEPQLPAPRVPRTASMFTGCGLALPSRLTQYRVASERGKAASPCANPANSSPNSWASRFQQVARRRS
jgi:hypothetical protein